jgi:hypothetical protein
MKVHITLVGGQPVPVYHGIVATQPDKVIYIYSQQSAKALESIKAELNLPHEVFLLTPVNPQEIKKKAEELAEIYKNDDVTVNISSGPKSWSHLFGLTFDKYPNADVVYIDQNNVLWNYSDFTHKSDFKYDMFAIFRLADNALKHYTDFSVYTEEDDACAKEIEKIRRINFSDFNHLTAILSSENQKQLHDCKNGEFFSGYSSVRWHKETATEEPHVTFNIYDKYGKETEKELSSPHIIELTFNSGWFEYKIARILSKWNKAENIYMNCKFPSKENLDKNEVDIIVDTGTKLLFVECKTQIADTTTIDKFSTVVKTYGGTGSKGIFITDSQMKNLATEKCNERKLMHFSLHYTSQNGKFATTDINKLYELLDNELFNFNI